MNNEGNYGSAQMLKSANEFRAALDMPAIQKKKRECLRCETIFTSDDHLRMRLCHPCRKLVGKQNEPEETYAIKI